MKMLRWILGKTRRDMIRNNLIRKTVGMTTVSKNIQGQILQWFGHVRHIDENFVGRRRKLLEADGRRGRGKPQRRWKHCLAEDLTDKGLGEENPMSRNEWRRRVRNSDP
ncbi:uncharacterized protein [Diabrotica undecimpunctata]|uniref:uncharacterized protein n=1 Tax=Diabrotica undecimpunctata TaxID=50387 RepID=UPI003B63A02C